MNLAIIVAVAENGVIGRDGKLPWHLSADLRRFRRLTMGHAIVMGRKTWESIGHPLRGRTSIVISHQADYQTGYEEVPLATSFDQAVAIAKQADCDPEKLFIIGGAAIYASALPQANRMYFTRIHAEIPGDVFFPEVDWSQWKKIEQSRHKADEFNDYDHTFSIYERI